MTDTETLESTSLHSQIQDLYDRGLYLQAFELSKTVGPIKEWKGARSRVLGARLANHVGSLRLGRTLLRLAHRETPTDPEVLFFYTYAMLSRRGPYQTFEAMQKIGDLESASEETRSDWFALRGLVYSIFRDFEKADLWINRAIEIDPNRAWLHVQRSTILEQQDRMDEAIASAQHALQLEPCFRPAIQDLANRFVQRHQDDQAVELLRAGNEKIESGQMRMQLGELFLEMERFEEARDMVQDIESYFPLMKMDSKTLEGLAAMSADMNYFCGDFTAAAEQAHKANTPFFEALAKRLSDPEFEGKRVKLPVKFVRQNHLTCAPATLTAISNYWGVEAEHLDIVEKICYDGTPAHSERKWATESGFTTREFRVTWDIAVQLIDHGIPFTLTTVDPGLSHLQAVIGYDEYRRSLMIRDPGDRHSQEFNVDKMLEHYEANGPRGMALIPLDKSHLLENLELPEVEMYDLYYQMQVDLDGHKRAEAAEVLNQMIANDAQHRITLTAESVMARYDSDLRQLLTVIEKLLEKYPKDVNTMAVRLSCLSELGKAEDRIATLKTICADADCNPIFWTQLAGELLGDARQLDQVNYLLKQAIRYRSHDALAYGMLGEVLFEEQREQAAVDTLRFAACLDEKNEARAKQYFYAARVTNQMSTAMQFLQDRVERFGKQSSLPARTLCWAYDQLEQPKKSFGILETAYQHHSDDGDLLLYMAEYFARWSQFEKGEEFLSQAKPIAHAANWTRVAAMISVYQGKSAEALQHWLALLEQNPLDDLAHRFICGLLADEGGDEAALAHIRKYVERFPYSYSLRSMLIEWVKDEDSTVVEKELNLFLEMHPDDAWALHELAILHLQQRDMDKASEFIDRAHEVDPVGPATYYLRGRVHNARNETAQAIQQYREALTHSIDNDFVVAALVNCCDSKSERETQLEFVLAELNRQISLGDGLLIYHSLAQTCLEPNELLATLTTALEEGVEQWQAWVAVIRQLSSMQRHDEAIELANQATKRYPLLPRIWMELASANASCGRVDQEINAIRKAKEINPTWSEAVRQLAEALEKKGDLDAARKEIEAAIRDEPRDVVNLGFLACIMWDQDEKEEALQLVAKAVRMQPAYEFGWNLLRDWCAALGKPDFDVEVATELTKARPKEARSWMMLALTLDQPHQIEEAIAALDQGIQLNPLNLDCYHQKSVLYCRLGSYDLALQAASPEAFGDDLPIELIARGAWVEGERGDFAKAVKDMEAVLKVDPDYYWAWQETAQWYSYLEKKEAYLAAAQEMVRIQPQNAVSWGYLGNAELAHDRRENAIAHFRQAVQLAPTYSYASSRLIDLLVADENWDEAKAILEYIAPHISPEWVVAEQAKIAALSGDQELAFEKLQQICEMPAEDASAIDEAVEAMYVAGYRDETLEFLTRQLEKPDALPGVAFVFVHLSTTMGKWDLCEQTLYNLMSRPKLWEMGAQKFLIESATAEEFAQQPRLKNFLKDHNQKLRADTTMWEHVGSALCQGNLDAEVCDWMAQWRDYQDATCWGLFALSCSLWDRKREHEADKVTQHVIKNLEPTGFFGEHLVYASLYQIIYGSPELAFEHIRDVDPMNMNLFSQLRYEYVICVLQNLGSNGSYADLRNQLKAIYENGGPTVHKEAFAVRTYRLVQSAAARLHGKKLRSLKWKFQAK